MDAWWRLHGCVSASFPAGRWRWLLLSCGALLVGPTAAGAARPTSPWRPGASPFCGFTLLPHVLASTGLHDLRRLRASGGVHHLTHTLTSEHGGEEHAVR